MSIGSYYDRCIQLFCLHHIRCQQMHHRNTIHRDLRHVEALKLFLVKINGDHTVYTCCLKHLSYISTSQAVVHRSNLCDTTVPIVRNYSTDTRGGSSSGSTHKQKKLHQVVIDLIFNSILLTYRRAGRLDNEDLLSTNVTVDLDVDLIVIETTNLSIRNYAKILQSHSEEELPDTDRSTLQDPDYHFPRKSYL